MLSDTLSDFVEQVYQDLNNPLWADLWWQTEYREELYAIMQRLTEIRIDLDTRG